MIELLSRPWPWYVAGPLIGIFPAVLLLLGNKVFGVSSSLRHTCAAVYPRNVAFFRYDWRREGGWSIAFALGILIGGVIAGVIFRNHAPVAISPHTRADLAALGVRDFTGLVPHDLFRWASLLTLRGWALLVLGGFLVGFGTAYAGGCTSGHGMAGVGDLQPSSMIALVAFFAGGMLGTWVLLPLVLRL
jgi:uncharacterized membrane protein YedE/YeeE